MTGLPGSLRTLLDRYDPSVLDVQNRRLRLVVGGEGQWDVVAGAVRADVVAGTGSRAPDATLSADRDTWDRIAADVRGGLEAHRAGRLVIRHNLHLGVGFLAATSGDTRPSRLRFERVRTRSGEISVLTAGAGEPVCSCAGSVPPRARSCRRSRHWPARSASQMADAP